MPPTLQTKNNSNHWEIGFLLGKGNREEYEIFVGDIIQAIVNVKRRPLKCYVSIEFQYETKCCAYAEKRRNEIDE